MHQQMGKVKQIQFSNNFAYGVEAILGFGMLEKVGLFHALVLPIGI